MAKKIHGSTPKAPVTIASLREGEIANRLPLNQAEHFVDNASFDTLVAQLASELNSHPSTADLIDNANQTLSEERVLNIKDHLHACPRCRNQAATYARIQDQEAAWLENTATYLVIERGLRNVPALEEMRTLFNVTLLALAQYWADKISVECNRFWGCFGIDAIGTCSSRIGNWIAFGKSLGLSRVQFANLTYWSIWEEVNRDELSAVLISPRDTHPHCGELLGQAVSKLNPEQKKLFSSQRDYVMSVIDSSY